MGYGRLMPLLRPKRGPGVFETLAMLVVSSGQSLAMRRSARVTTSAVADALIPRNTDGSGTSQNGDETDFVNDAFAPTWEAIDGALVGFTENAAGEGWGPGTCDVFNSQPGVEKVAFYAPADGARHFRELSRGSGRWTAIHISIDRMLASLIADSGYAKSAVTPICIWTQGESDADTSPPGGGGSEAKVSQAQYETILGKLATDFRDMLSVIWEEPRTDPLYVTPLLSGAYTDGSRNVQNAQLAKHNDSTIVLLPSPAQFAEHYETDGVHMSGAGRRLYAELAAWAIRAHRSGSWTPLAMTSAVRSGTTVTVTFNQEIQIDTSTIDEIDATNYPKQNKGFQFYDDSTEIEITDVSVEGSVATLTLDSTPSGAETVRMSQQEWPGGSASNNNMARSNVRAPATVGTAVDDTPLYNFAVPQTIEVS